MDPRRNSLTGIPIVEHAKIEVLSLDPCTVAIDCSEPTHSAS
jgi:hypothetical protein